MLMLNRMSDANVCWRIYKVVDYFCLFFFSVISHDLRRCRAVIVDRCSAVRLPVNTSLIEPFEARLSSLYQFIGDIESSDTDSGVADRCLKATSYRCVDGLDLAKYYHAVDARSAYLQQRNKCSSN